MNKGLIGIILICLLIFTGLLAFLSSIPEREPDRDADGRLVSMNEVWKDFAVDFSDVVEDIPYYSTHYHHETREYLVNETHNITTIVHNMHFYVNGYIVYTAWNASYGCGVYVATGLRQVENKETSKFVAFLTQDKRMCEQWLTIGSIVSLRNKGIQWTSIMVDGEQVRYLDKVDSYITENKRISLEDPSYQSVLNALSEYQRRVDACEAATLTAIIVIVVIIPIIMDP